MCTPTHTTYLQFATRVPDILAIWAVWVPVQLAVPEVLGLVRLPVEARGEGPQDGLHHGQVLQIIVGLGGGERREDR